MFPTMHSEATAVADMLFPGILVGWVVVCLVATVMGVVFGSRWPQKR